RSSPAAASSSGARRLARRGRAPEQTVVAQQRLGGRRAPAELLEDLHRVTAAAEREHGVAEATSGRDQRLLVLETGLLERRERVGGEHLGPLVAVVARRVAAAEDVREAAQEAVLGQRRQHGGLLRDAPLHVERGLGAVRVELVVQREVGQREVELAQHVGARTERARRGDLAEQLLGQ